MSCSRGTNPLQNGPQLGVSKERLEKLSLSVSELPIAALYWKISGPTRKDQSIKPWELPALKPTACN